MLPGMKTNFKNKLVFHYHLHDDGIFPNSVLPVVLYKSAFELPLLNPGGSVITHLKKNFWENSWKNGVYDYHHYHSTAHEIIVAYKGNAKLMLGGENGIVIELETGDALVIPAGVAHKNISPDNKFKCVGAYPKGQDYDMNYGKPVERPAADENIKTVPLPLTDPVFGDSGPLFDLWKIKLTSPI
jgi:uncharacterized protein YjlB